MKVKIEIDTKTFVRFWLVVIGFILAGLAIISAGTALLIIGISIFLAIALSPYVNRVMKLLPGKKIHRVLSTAIAYLSVVAALSLVVTLVVPPIVSQTAKFAQTVPSLLESVNQQYSGFGHVFSRYGLESTYNQIIQSIGGSAKGLAASVGTNIVSGLGSVVTMIGASVIVFVLTFLMLVEGPGWIDTIWGLYRNRETMKHHKQLAERMYKVLTGFITGQASVAVVDGVVTGLAVFIISLIFHAPSDLALPAAAIVFILALIPFFGSATGQTLVCLILLLNNIHAAIAYLIFYIIYLQIEGNIISPHIQSKYIQLSPMVILISIVIGVYMLGIIGGIISIPIAGCLKVLFEDYYKQNKQHRTFAKAKPAFLHKSKK